MFDRVEWSRYVSELICTMAIRMTTETPPNPEPESPCPCGSEIEFKNCCMKRIKEMEEAHRAAWPSIALDLEKRRRADRVRRARYGEVKPILNADYKGYKVVAVGDRIHFSKQWRTFPDFLEDYIKQVFDPEWFTAELRKPLVERHQILEWYDAKCRFMQQQELGPDGLCKFIPNAAPRAYWLLSYDLYTVKHHAELQAAVVNRLKLKDHFQGARHELFAAATCIRAGYEIAFEDETDKTRKHTEFIATHRPTGQKIAVEAKSKRRRGVLGYPGDLPQPFTIRVDIERLLEKAFNKPVIHPYVVFLDLNLPPTGRRLLESRWFTEIGDTITQVAARSGDRDPFSLIVLSNFPDNYATAEPGQQAVEIVTTIGKHPQVHAAHREAIVAIHHAAVKFGNVPNRFDETK